MKKLASLAKLAALIFFAAPVAALAQEEPKVVTIQGSGFEMVDNVNVRNGDFAISYTFFNTGSGIPFILTYNSLSSQDGWFGRGWGSPFETRMLYMPDGSAIVQENGTGSYTVYGKPEGAALVEEVNALVSAATLKNPKLDAVQFRKNLMASPGARFDAVKTYGMGRAFPEGVSLPVDPATIFVSTGCDDDKLHSYGLFVIRVTCNRGRLDTFEEDGHLHRQYYGDISHFIRYETNNDDNISSILVSDDNDRPIGKSLNFDWSENHVTKIVDERDIPMTFTYDARGNLIKAVENSGNFYTYSYDAHENMTNIRYIDDSHMRITYDANDRVTSVADRVGNVTTYEYQRDFSNPNAFSTRVTRKRASGTIVTVYRMSDQ